MTFIHAHQDVILFALAFLIAWAGYSIGKGVAQDLLASRIAQLEKEVREARKVLSDYRLQVSRGGANHPAGRALYAVKEGN
jgi:hypothetical protein